jgi:hypothetical protein
MEPTGQGLYLAVNPLRIIACARVLPDGELTTLTFPLHDSAAGALALQILAQLQLREQLDNAANDAEFLRRAGVSIQ